MSPQLHYDMDDALARLEVDEDVRVVVVAAKAAISAPDRTCKKFFRELERNPGERKKAAAAANRWRWERLYELRQTDHRHDPGLLRRRRVHATAGLRFRHRGRGRHLLAVGGELGHPARRAGVQGRGRRGAAAPRALLRLPGRAVRRQGGGAHRHDQFRGSGQEAGGRGDRSCRTADEEEPGGAARHQARDPPCAHDGRAAGLRLPRRQGTGDQGRRQGGFLQHRPAPVPRREIVQADLSSRSSSARCWRISGR